MQIQNLIGLQSWLPKREVMLTLLIALAAICNKDPLMEDLGILCQITHISWAQEGVAMLEVISARSKLTMKFFILAVDPSQTLHRGNKVIDCDVSIIVSVRKLEDAANVWLARKFWNILKVCNGHASCSTSLPFKSEHRAHMRL